jgi:hypothetical protein
MDKTIEYKEIEGFSGYFAGSDGNLYGNSRKWQLKEGEEYYKIVGKRHNRGYQEYGLFKDGKRKWFCIHQLIATAFLGDKPSDKHEVHHINNDRLDNRPDNLQWVTRSENIYLSYHSHGRENLIRPIYYGGKKYISIRACAVEEGLNQQSLNSTLSKMRANGLTETLYKGKVLKYATETKIKGPCVLSDWEISPKV